MILLFQALVQFAAQGTVARVGKEPLDVAVQRQQCRHRAEARDLGMDRLRLEFKLALGLLTALGPGALFGQTPGPVHAQQQADEYQRNDQGYTQAVGQGRHDGARDGTRRW